MVNIENSTNSLFVYICLYIDLITILLLTENL